MQLEIVDQGRMQAEELQSKQLGQPWDGQDDVHVVLSRLKKNPGMHFEHVVREEHASQ